MMQRHSHRSSGRCGFTLVETGLAIIIVATSMLAMVAAHEAFVQQNQWGERASQAARLGAEIRERSMVLAVSDPVTGTATWGTEAGEGTIFDWDDMDDFDGLDVSGYGGDGPIDASGSVIPAMDGWRQVVAVQSVDPTNLAIIMPDGMAEAVRVTVDVFWQESAIDPGDLVTTVTWVHMQ
jgi:type II secretory pathway pseudopilin PulG|tara:strand:- start:315 stop:854 length:540 start_codon:yes stop_codon:yes gene_type:complete